MTLTRTQRQIGLACALALTIAGTTVFGDNEPASVETPAPPIVAAQPKAPEGGEKPGLLTLDKLNRTPPAAEGVDLFASKSWYVPPPSPPPPPPMTPVKAGPPPTPKAPSLPFSYVGQMEGKDGLLVYISRGGELLLVRPGDQIDQNYRLEAVTAEQLTFMYLPLGERQFLSAGGK